MKARLALIAGAVAALTACGNATDAVTFQAPANFHSKASFGPFMQLWESGPHTVMILMSLPVQTDLDKALDQAQLKDAKVLKSGHTQLCGGSQDAIYAQVEGQTNSGGSEGSKPSEIEFVATNVKGKTYMAMYARPLHTAPDPAAEAAVKNICPK